MKHKRSPGMPGTKKIKWQNIVILIITLLFWGRPAVAAEFSAGMVENKPGGKTTTSKISVKDAGYVIETQEDGMQIKVIVDQDDGKTRVLVPAEKVYLEFDNSNPVSMMNNPFLAAKYSAEKFESGSAGIETVNGFECEKTIITGQGQEIMAIWTASELDFPVRIKNSLIKGREVNLKDIHLTQFDEDFFNVPPDFKKVDRIPEQVPVPVWAGDIPSAPLLSPT